MYQRSINEPDAFWLEQANTLEWIKKPQIALASLNGIQTKRKIHECSSLRRWKAQCDCQLYDRHIP